MKCEGVSLRSGSLPEETSRESSHVILAKMPGGGHMGFFDGPWSGRGKRERWMIKPILEFLQAMGPSEPVSLVKPLLVEKEEGGWFRCGTVTWRPSIVCQDGE